jgi:hypothetical protein
MFGPSYSTGSGNNPMGIIESTKLQGKRSKSLQIVFFSKIHPELSYFKTTTIIYHD